nr:retrovirus-related Pol polyprotein from transposon TNT 1-94 [Tanacetum cinerariifolium]
MILESVEHGLLIWLTIKENRVTRTKKYAELSATEKIQADCDLKATDIILQGTRTNTSGTGENYSGQQRVVKCFNCQGEAQRNGKTLNKEELEFLTDPDISKGPVTQSVITHNAAYQTDDLDAYDSDCNDISTAKAVLMANLSSYGSDVLYEMEAAVQQYHVDKQHFKIQKKQFLIENDRLVDQIISQDIVNIVVTSSMDVNTFVKVHSSVAMNDYVNYVEMYNKCLELEAELIKQYNMVEKDEDMMASSPICLLSKVTKTKSWLWHRRLSHLNFGAINHLARHNLVRGLPILKFEKDHLCYACVMGKSKKQSHKPKSKDTNQEKLYLLHMDLCGPMRVSSINEKNYILVIVNDYSRFTWVKFLASKDEAPDFIIKFLKMIQVRLYAFVRNIRTDNGTEFVNQTLRDYYEQVGIFHETSAARTPQQSGVVERRNRTLVKAARTIKSDLSYLHVFGVLCYPNNDSENLGKLQAKVGIGIFIGYAPKKKAYRIYNRRTPKIIETIHVDFDELMTMAFEQLSSGPGLQLFDEFFSPSASVASPVHVEEDTSPIKSTGSPFSTTFDQDASSTSTSQNTPQSQSQTIPLSAEEESHDLEVSHMSNDLYFGTPVPRTVSEESSLLDVISTIVHSDTPISEHLSKWTKDHPLQNISVEPKMYKDALTELCWIEAMQEELHEFERLEVWKLVPRPDKVAFGHCRDALSIVIYIFDYHSLEILQSPSGIFLNQSKYALESLNKYRMESCNIVDTSMVEKSKLDGDKQRKSVDPTHYRGMVGTLIYLTSSRPGLIFPTQMQKSFLQWMFMFIMSVIPQSLPSFTPPPQQSTPTPPPTTKATNPLTALLNFTSVFQFNNRVIELEKEVAELKRNDPLNTQILLKEVSNFAPSVIKSIVTESLEHAVLAKESSQPKSIYEVVVSLTKFELKKILIDKMDESQSNLTTAEHRECYDRLIKSYDLDKSLFSTYDKVYSLKRSRKDKDKDEDPSARLDRGLKKRKTSKDAESTKGPKAKESKSGSSKGAKSRSKSYEKSAHAEEPEFEVADYDMPQDQEENLGNDNEKPKGKVASKRDWFTKPKRPQEPTDPDWNVGKTPQQGPT